VILARISKNLLELLLEFHDCNLVSDGLQFLKDDCFKKQNHFIQLSDFFCCCKMVQLFGTLVKLDLNEVVVSGNLAGDDGELLPVVTDKD
jgi:hypothetical protein